MQFVQFYWPRTYAKVADFSRTNEKGAEVKRAPGVVVLAADYRISSVHISCVTSFLLYLPRQVPFYAILIRRTLLNEHFAIAALEFQ